MPATPERSLKKIHSIPEGQLVRLFRGPLLYLQLYEGKYQKLLFSNFKFALQRSNLDNVHLVKSDLKRVVVNIPLKPAGVKIISICPASIIKYVFNICRNNLRCNTQIFYRCTAPIGKFYVVNAKQSVYYECFGFQSWLMRPKQA